MSVERFEANATYYLKALELALRNGSYKPAPIRRPLARISSTAIPRCSVGWTMPVINVGLIIPAITVVAIGIVRNASNRQTAAG
jgi:hypothetical protein